MKLRTVCAIGMIAILASVGWAARTTKADLEEFPIPGVSAQTPGYFAFVIPPLDDSAAWLDMSFLNPEPAGASGRVRAVDGHFVDPKGKRIRLLGSNCTFSTAFPDKDIAPAIAGHMRKLGMNVIRFHHMDMRNAPSGIWNKERTAFDPEQLDKLDWFIYQLNQHGIYANINLHVSRTYPGIPKDAPRAYRYGKALDNFYPEFIRLQKEYARDLLTHRNPYTKKTYAKDPGVIVVEINNENALTKTSMSSLGSMPEPYKGELQRQWNAWIKKRYGNTAALRKAWNAEVIPLGKDILRNADFSQGTGQWLRLANSGARMELSVEDAGAGVEGKALRIDTTKVGNVAWSLQFGQTNLTLENGKSYTLRFKMRADGTRKISTGVRLGKAPWKFVGLRTKIEVAPEWREYQWTFQVRGAEPNAIRFELNFDNQLGSYWLTEPSLRPGGVVGLQEDESVEKANVPMPTSTGATRASLTDFCAFLGETERAYAREMTRFLKEDLGVGAMITDTQVSYGNLQGMVREATISDYCDMHAYWKHPHFPVRPWHPQYWSIPNVSMVTAKSAGTFHLAWRRFFGKPFTVSEYDHPFPMSYGAELFPMLASVAAFQDWDGIYQFSYGAGNTRERLTDHRVGGFFSLATHAGKKAFLPFAAVMLRMGAVAPGADPLVAEVVPSKVPAYAAEHGRGLAATGTDPKMPVMRPVGFRLADKGDSAYSIPESRGSDDGIARSNTGQIVWDSRMTTMSSYTINAPAVRLAVGFIGGRTFEFGNATIKVGGEANSWACVGVCGLDGKALSESEKILIAAVGEVQNTGMMWNKKRDSVGKNKGKAPTIAQGIEATITLPRAGSAFTLDGTGKKVKDIAVKPLGRKAVIEIGPEHRAVWYGVTP